MSVPAKAEPHGDEKWALLEYLEVQRTGLRLAAHGLTEEQATSTPSASELSVAGVIKHAAWGEKGWVVRMRGERQRSFQDQMQDWENSFRLLEGETVASVLEFWDEVRRETEEAVRAVPSLNDTFDNPAVPWDPEGGPRSWRWGLLHLLEEFARHAGHADVIRETIDSKISHDLEIESGALPEPDWTLLQQS
ncbi:DinB family protein [Streptomyces sp. NPDC005438]|uniref:DinB family protein n=1 Tax=Streptomyces sp. NPDC005438 TaxID=3156880 RepID=UPI0033BE13C8